MRFCLITQTGYGLGLMPHLTKEGHAVDTIFTGDEIVTLPDFAFFDSNLFKDIASDFRNKGVKVLGISDWSTLLDTNLEYKNSIIQAIGYKAATPDTQGVKATVVALFNGNNFLLKALAFNYTKLMAGDVGVDVESAGYVVYFGKSGSLISNILEPLAKYLRKVNHRGSFCVDVICNAQGVFVSDISANMNKPCVQAVFENSRKDKASVLISLFDENSTELYHYEPVVCGVMLSEAPYPYAIPDKPLIIEGVNPGNLKHMWPVDMKDNKKGEWYCARMSGCLAYVVARGKDIWEAKRRAYQTIKNIHTPNLQYRNDIGKDVDEKMHQLRQLSLV